MAEDAQKSGLVVSGLMHLALLAVLTLGFSSAPRFEDATESIPVETISQNQLNEIMQGEKEAKPSPDAKPAPPPKPQPAEPPTPPQPPSRPEPQKPEPPTPRPTPAPEPPKRPDPPKPQTEDAPEPPQRPRIEKVEKVVETPRPPERPKPPKPEEPPKPAFRPDDIAKALAKDKPDPKPQARSNFDPTAISRMIGQTKTAELSDKPAPQGLPNRQSPRMSVSLENGLNEWFRDSYKNCWNLPPSNPSGENYVFDVRVTFNPDGSLSGRPVMLNPPHDQQWRAHADSVMRAVARCNPLRIPAQYAPYFDQWRSKTIHFDPSSAEG